MLSDRYIIKMFFPTFILSLCMFAFIVELADVFSNIFKYLQNNVAILDVATIQLLYLPKSFVIGMPIACIFSASFVMGTLQVRYEILGFFSSGFSLVRMIIPLLVLGMLVSISSFVLNEFVAIKALKQKESAVDKALGRMGPMTSAGKVVYEKGKQRIWRAGFYNHENLEIQKITIVQRDAEGGIVRIDYADNALWVENHWSLRKIQRTNFLPNGEIELKILETLDEPDYDLPPQTFRGAEEPIDSLELGDAWLLVERRIATGMTYRMEQTRYYERFSFAFTPLVVTLLAVTAGRKFRKHVLILSLLVSLGLAIAYYVIQMIAVLMATLGFIPSFIGAWTGFILFLGIGVFLLWYNEKV